MDHTSVGWMSRDGHHLSEAFFGHVDLYSSTDTLVLFERIHGMSIEVPSNLWQPIWRGWDKVVLPESVRGRQAQLRSVEALQLVAGPS